MKAFYDYYTHCTPLSFAVATFYTVCELKHVSYMCCVYEQASTHYVTWIYMFEKREIMEVKSI